MEGIRNESRSEILQKYVLNLEVGGKETETIDMGTEHTADAPLLVAPGWASTLPVYAPMFRELVTAGRHIISLNHPRTGDKKIFSDEELQKLSSFPEVERQKASNLLELLDSKHLSEGTKVDVIAHSEGCINAIAAAIARPERFRNIVLVAPPGFLGKDSLVRLATGFLKWQALGRKGMPTMEEMSVSDEVRSAVEAEGRTIPEYPTIAESKETKETQKIAFREGLKYQAGNPIRGAKEVIDMPSIQLDQAIQELREKGIGIVIVSGVDDPLFPTKMMAEHFGKGELDGFLSVRGSHAQIGEQPERYAVAANQMLVALRDRKKPTADTSAG